MFRIVKYWHILERILSILTRKIKFEDLYEVRYEVLWFYNLVIKVLTKYLENYVNIVYISDNIIFFHFNIFLSLWSAESIDEIHVRLEAKNPCLTVKISNSR